MFAFADLFNGYVSGWNTAKVTAIDVSYFSNMLYSDLSFYFYEKGMFWEATSFNGDISSWNVEKVITMNVSMYLLHVSSLISCI